MSNSSTIAGVTTCLPSGNVTVETAFGISPLGTVRGTLSVPDLIGNSSLDGHELILRAGILVTSGVATNYTPAIHWQSGANTNLTTFAGDTTIFSTVVAINGITRLFTVLLRVNWAIDPTPANSRLNGTFSFSFDNTFQAWAALGANLTSGVSNASDIEFFLTGIFSVSNANNTAVLKYFEMDLV